MSDIKDLIENEEPEKKKRGRKKKADTENKSSTTEFDDSEYYIDKEVQNIKGEIEIRRALKPKYDNHLFKCKLRAARQFKVSLQHLDKALYFLNGKKIDGIFINDIVGRFGYYDGEQKNRAELSDKYKITKMNYEATEDKLAKILQESDVEKAYTKYINFLEKENNREIKEQAVFG